MATAQSTGCLKIPNTHFHGNERFRGSYAYNTLTVLFGTHPEKLLSFVIDVISRNEPCDYQEYIFEAALLALIETSQFNLLQDFLGDVDVDCVGVKIWGRDSYPSRYMWTNAGRKKTLLPLLVNAGFSAINTGDVDHITGEEFGAIINGVKPQLQLKTMCRLMAYMHSKELLTVNTCEVFITAIPSYSDVLPNFLVTLYTFFDSKLAVQLALDHLPVNNTTCNAAVQFCILSSFNPVIFLGFTYTNLVNKCIDYPDEHQYLLLLGIYLITSGIISTDTGNTQVKEWMKSCLKKGLLNKYQYLARENMKKQLLANYMPILFDILDLLDVQECTYAAAYTWLLFKSISVQTKTAPIDNIASRVVDSKYLTPNVYDPNGLLLMCYECYPKTDMPTNMHGECATLAMTSQPPIPFPVFPLTALKHYWETLRKPPHLQFKRNTELEALYWQRNVRYQSDWGAEII